MTASIIICAYNEEATIAEVVRSCRTYNPDSELIVVDDGSSDDTEGVLKIIAGQYNFKYYHLKENKGKSWAMAYGVQKAKNEIILFMDADVAHLNPMHFTQLLHPLKHGDADMVMGQPTDTLIDYRINPFRSLTGERAMFKKDLIPILDDIRDIRFGVETFLNMYYQAKGKKIKLVLLEGLIHPTKFAKTNALNATKEFMQEGQEIALTVINNTEFITQRIRRHLDNSVENLQGTILKLNTTANKSIKKVKEVVTESLG